MVAISSVKKIEADRSQGYGVERFLRHLLRSPATDRPTARVPVHAEPLLVPAHESLQSQPDEDNGCLARGVPETNFRSFLAIGPFPIIYGHLNWKNRPPAGSNHLYLLQHSTRFLKNLHCLIERG
jgi:hypothetical protein